ncbi:MAG: glycosyltransferase family 2 protein [Myxococcales bacterium]|nr:glycosyltransferase family 2 protein [Myxococcales bacterium]MCB9713649.1 glycosyltransferase family 2 protein [Myxococcales bacterium]
MSVVTPSSPPGPEISIVVPVLNEVESLAQLYQELHEALRALGRSYEILFVDDGSTDGSGDRLDAIADADPQVRVVHFRKNFGKSPALNAAFERVAGQIVLTLDADLQDDPAMIPEFIARIEAGADLVSGWKQQRHDPVGKTAPSKLFNWVVRRVSGVQLMDFNCGFKAYRLECIRELSVYGGFHRFLPVLAGWKGYSVEQLVVRHRPRAHGSSKFGVTRYFDGMLDLLTVLMVTRYRTRPLHFFGVLGAASGSVGVLLLSYLTVLWFQGEPIGHRPLLTLGVLLTLAAVQFIGVGLVGELLVRTTISSREVFSIRSTRGFPSDSPRALPSSAGSPALVPAPSAMTTSVDVTVDDGPAAPLDAPDGFS